MRYIPHTEEDLRHMLATIGISEVAALFESIPADLRLGRPLDLPPALDELNLTRHLSDLAMRNVAASCTAHFLGGGAYHHHVPPAVDQLLLRSEFYTAYTPYQPEISQGTLQAMFEFQTLVCQVLGAEVANASMYDGATAMTEAVLMARRLQPKRRRVLVSGAVHPEYRAVLATYLRVEPDLVSVLPVGTTGTTDFQALAEALTDDVAAVVVQYPNFFGCVEPLADIAPLVKDAGALLIATFSEALAFGLLKPPGELGADICAGEGQSFGVPLQFGGPYLGLLATHGRFVRNLPGRLVGQTVDAQGRTGYVLTLSTREQHIRREKATSNICSNQGLCALAACIYLALMGPQGLRHVATLNHRNARRLKQAVTALPGFAPVFSTPTFNEFVVRTPVPARDVVAALSPQYIVPGLDLGRFDPAWDHWLLMTATELNTPEDLTRLIAALRAL